VALRLFHGVIIKIGDQNRASRSSRLTRERVSFFQFSWFCVFVEGGYILPFLRTY